MQIWSGEEENGGHVDCLGGKVTVCQLSSARHDSRGHRIKRPLQGGNRSRHDEIGEGFILLSSSILRYAAT